MPCQWINGESAKSACPLIAIEDSATEDAFSRLALCYGSTTVSIRVAVIFRSTSIRAEPTSIRSIQGMTTLGAGLKLLHYLSVYAVSYAPRDE
jgi:hypothetical protein